jgi:hypothetical protein
VEEEEMKKLCHSCLIIKDEEEFEMKYPAIGVRRNICKSCQPKQKRLYILKKQTEIRNGKVFV